MRAAPEHRHELSLPIYGAYEYARSLLKPGDTVLDVGCGNGKVSAYLAEVGVVVDGVEPHEARARVALERVRYLSTRSAGDNDAGLLDEYNVVTFFDVIEHFQSPEATLTWAKSMLAPNGKIITMIPNSGHWSFRKRMLRGDWKMEDWGLFDRTHLHFYDVRTIGALCPQGMRESVRQYFTPDVRIPRVVLGMFPSLLALHTVVVWEDCGDG